MLARSLARRPRNTLDTLSDFPWSGSLMSKVYDNIHFDENEDLIYTLEIPGVDKREVHVSVIPEDRMLQVKTPNYSMKRTIGTDYSLEDIYASVENGLLELKIPRRKKNTLEIEIH